MTDIYYEYSVQEVDHPCTPHCDPTGNLRYANDVLRDCLRLGYNVRLRRRVAASPWEDVG